MSTTKIWGRGQLTIPASLRKELGLKEDSVVNLVKVGDSLLLVPQPLEGDRLANNFSKAMKKKNITLEDLLSDLKKVRKNYVKEHYGA